MRKRAQLNYDFRKNNITFRLTYSKKNSVDSDYIIFENILSKVTSIYSFEKIT